MDISANGDDLDGEGARALQDVVDARRLAWDRAVLAAAESGDGSGHRSGPRSHDGADDS